MVLRQHHDGCPRQPHPGRETRRRRVQFGDLVNPDAVEGPKVVLVEIIAPDRFGLDDDGLDKIVDALPAPGAYGGSQPRVRPGHEEHDRQRGLAAIDLTALHGATHRGFRIRRA